MTNPLTGAAIPTTLTGQFRRHFPTFAVGAVYLLAFNLLRAGIDLFLKRGVDDLQQGRFADTTRVGLCLVAMTAVALLMRVLSRVTLFNGGRDIEYELRNALLAKLHTLGPSFFRRMPVGEVMSRTTNDLAQVRLLFGFGALNFVNTAFAYVSALAIMTSLSPRLTLASLGVYPPLMLLTRGFSRSIFLRTRESQDALGVMSDRVQSNLAGVRVVRSFALERSEEQGFAVVNDDYLVKSLAIARVRGMMGPAMMMMSTMGTLIVFWYGGRLVVSERLSPGAFVAFLSALGRLAWPTMALGFMLSIIQRGRASFMRLADVFGAVPEVTSGKSEAPPAIRGELSVRRLSFKYGDRAVLDEVGFDVPAGCSVAVVGRTGAGKTTLASLLPRLLPTPKGAIFLDGIDVCDLPLTTVRRAIGYAQQDAFLFSTTISKNVGFCLDDPESPPSLERIARALDEAQIAEEVQRFDGGIDTVVGERGVQLSGGQRQRVALARALLREPPILVLDDPLSAVDAKTETAILRAIERQQRLRTVLLITHRVAAAARCDHIVVLDGGKVVQRGTHEELLRQDGLYARMAREQEIAGALDALGKMTLSASERTIAPLVPPQSTVGLPPFPAEGCA